MSQFTLTLDLTDHTHDHSPRNHRHLIGAMLDDAKGVIGRTEADEGELVYPPGSHKVIGSWKIIKDGDEQS